MVQAYLTNGLTGMVLIVFAAALHSALRRAGEGSSTLTSILLGSGWVAASLSCLEALFVQVLANHLAATGDAAVIRTLLELNAEIDTFKLPVLGALIGTTSLLAWRVSALPRWLVWVGAVEVLLLVIASGSTPFPGLGLTSVLYISGVGLLLWVASVSIVMGWGGRVGQHLTEK